jgi:hypothetical protein
LLPQSDAAFSSFLSRVLLMDEACFTRNGILNIRKHHTWADENSRSFQHNSNRSLQLMFRGE